MYPPTHTYMILLTISCTINTTLFVCVCVYVFFVFFFHFSHALVEATRPPYFVVCSFFLFSFFADALVGTWYTPHLSNRSMMDVVDG